MDEQEFKRRTKDVGLRIIKLVESLPNSRTSDVIGRQLLRSGLAIGANYRPACRAVSRANMISKLGDVEEEADEAVHWMEMLIESRLVPENKLRSLMNEVNAIVAMTVASIRTLRRKNPKSKTQNPKSP
ncbi:MAG TPA: four helix bundle protein [Thermoanaerobaculia bacterium]|nr:four helix bundle protein [Thermoanaerobaculia bacterium]